MGVIVVMKKLKNLILNVAHQFAFNVLNLPAKIKGAKIGKLSVVKFPYDFLFVKWKNIFISENVVIGRNAWLSTIGTGRIQINAGCRIGRDFVLASKSKVTIGANCLISYRVSILDHNHIFDSNIYVTTSGTDNPQQIKIGDGCFLGANVVVLPGVELGERCVVGANSVVTKSFAKNTIIAGAPAVSIGTIGLTKS